VLVAGSGRKVRSPEEAMALLEAWEASCERMSTWCGARGINWYSLSAFRGWMRSRDRGHRGDLELVEVDLSVAEVAAEPSAPARYRIELRGAVVEVDDHFHDHTLRRLLRVVATC
jgi:hypothetical protein